MSLDPTDRRLLHVLQRRGRISNADLAEEVNLSASACHRRVQRLESDGYIKGYVALLDPRKMGVPATIFVEITLTTQADEVLDAFEKAVARVHRVQDHRAAALIPYQSITTLPELPEIIAAKPCSKSSIPIRWVIRPDTSSPDCTSAIILYQVSYISRP